MRMLRPLGVNVLEVGTVLRRGLGLGNDVLESDIIV